MQAMESLKKQEFLRELSQSYRLLLRVFKYLSVKDLLVASCVCVMWRDLAYSSSLVRELVTIFGMLQCTECDIGSCFVKRIVNKSLRMTNFGVLCIHRTENFLSSIILIWIFMIGLI